jgi:hypothetical protein
VLDEPVAIDCIECPAGAFFNSLSAQTGVPIYLAGVMQDVTLSIYGIARLNDHLKAASVAMGAQIYRLGDAYVVEQAQDGTQLAVLDDFGKAPNGVKLNGIQSLVKAEMNELEMYKRVDWRPRFAYVDVAVVSGLAESELNLGVDVSATFGAEAGTLLVSVGVERDEESIIDVGEARYVRRTSVTEGIIVEQDVEELRIPRELKLLLGSDDRLRVELKNDTVRGEAAGLPEIARTQYQTVAYVDDRWRVVGKLTDRQAGAFLAFTEESASFRLRGRGRSSYLIARVRDAEQVRF